MVVGNLAKGMGTGLARARCKWADENSVDNSGVAARRQQDYDDDDEWATRIVGDLENQMITRTMKKKIYQTGQFIENRLVHLVGRFNHPFVWFSVDSIVAV